MPTQRVDLNRLLIFRAIVDTGSITKASVLLRQPKSNVSRQLRALEEEIGTQLVLRTTRSLQLTHAGLVLAKESLGFLASLEESLERIPSGTEIAGKIKISVPDDIGVQLMGSICQSFMILHPSVHVEVHVGNGKVDLIKEAFDLALRIGRLDDSTLIQKKIGNLRMGVYWAPEWRAKYGTSVSAEVLSHVPFLSFRAENRSIKIRIGKELMTVKVNPIFISNNFFIIRDLAIGAMGFAILPTFLVQDSLAKGLLVPVSSEITFRDFPAHLILPSQKDVPVRIKKFMEHIQAQLLAHTV